MLAQRQPSFKERVIAHWSSDSAPKMIGTKLETEAADVQFIVCGRRALYNGSKPNCKVRWTLYK